MELVQMGVVQMEVVKVRLFQMELVQKGVDQMGNRIQLCPNFDQNNVFFCDNVFHALTDNAVQ